MKPSSLIGLVAGGALAVLGCSDSHGDPSEAEEAGAAGIRITAGRSGGGGSSGNAGSSGRNAVEDAGAGGGGRGGAGGRAGGGAGKTATGGSVAADCKACEITLATTQSNAFHTIGPAQLLLKAELQGNTVFALGVAGEGRLAFSGDGNVIYREGECPMWNWLGDTKTRLPRVLCLGAAWPCAGKTDMGLNVNALDAYPGTLDYGGTALPERYVDQASTLRADYDVVVYFGITDLATSTWQARPEDASTLEQFVRVNGGGLYLISEYWGATGQPQLDSLNAIARPWGIEFEKLSLDWGAANASASLDCLPITGPD